jgi:hypothetical protein
MIGGLASLRVTGAIGRSAYLVAKIYQKSPAGRCNRPLYESALLMFQSAPVLNRLEQADEMPPHLR